jgi:hypothetical protein
MITFSCPVCSHLVTFESIRCLNCRSELGYDAEARAMRLADPGAGSGRCANNALAACNWLVAGESKLCRSCSLTRTRPHDSDVEGLAGFASAERAKRWLLFELLDMGLPVVAWRERDGGLAFDLLSSDSEPVGTGHADGVITLDLAETDPAHREQLRVKLGEPYRTVLGHFRHEVGHYYQTILVPPGSAAESRCRELFGDEREDYQQALKRYYADGPRPGWERDHVSAYATMHPWEDWAETWAHYLHVRDTLQTAAAYGVHVHGPSVRTADLAPLQSEPRAVGGDVGEMLEAWIPLTYALNAISRSMGAAALYPFVLGPSVERKLEFVGRLIAEAPRAERHSRHAELGPR